MISMSRTINSVKRYLFRYPSRWDIPPEQINLRTVLGSGTFGEVWKAVVWGLNGYPGDATVAVKKLKREKLFFIMSALRWPAILAPFIDSTIILNHWLTNHGNLYGIIDCHSSNCTSIRIQILASIAYNLKTNPVISMFSHLIVISMMKFNCLQMLKTSMGGVLEPPYICKN